MKRILYLAAGILAAAPVIAEQPVGLPTPVAGPTPTIGELLRATQGMRAQQTNAPAAGGEFNYQILVPIAINAPGRNGTFFRSDYFASNIRAINQEVLIGWISAGVNNAGASTSRFSLNASTVYSIPDFLGGGTGRLNQTGVGSILITAVLTGSSTPDPAGMISGSLRISTMEPTSTGTNSFTLNAVNPNTIRGDVNALVFGLRQNNDFRANYGLVNLDPVNSRTWTVTGIAGNTTSWSVTLPPVSMQQFAVPSSVAPTSTGYLLLQYTPTLTTDFQWYGFANTADNVTGNAWFNAAFWF
jgi:hypothetical protein